MTTQLKLNTIYEFKTDLAELKTANTFEFSQSVRKNSESKGVRLVIEAPKFLTPPSTLNSLEAKLYSHGAQEILKEFIRKWIKSNPDTKELVQIDSQVIEQFLLETGGKIITKESILELFESHLAEQLVINLATKGIENEEIIGKTIEAYQAFFLKLASPAIKFEDSINDKLVELLDSLETQTPVSQALIQRLTKKPEAISDLAKYL